MDQRLQAMNKLKSHSQSKYKSNLKKYEEIYHIPTPNNKDINISKKNYESRRMMAKCLKNMWNSFSNYNNRLSKWRSFLALKINMQKPKGAELLLETLHNIFKYGSAVTQLKSEFMYKIYENYSYLKQKESDHEQQIKSRVEGRLKQKWLSGWKNTSNKQNGKLQKIEKFYFQNLKIKAFFILLRYSRNKKELRTRKELEDKKIINFNKKIYFKKWKRAYTHKINMLANRKWFKVKFSDYWRWKQWLEAQMKIDIVPEFDKFITNPYPKISSVVNSSRVEREENNSTLQRSNMNITNLK